MAGSIRNLRIVPSEFFVYKKMIVIKLMVILSQILSCATQESSEQNPSMRSSDLGVPSPLNSPGASGNLPASKTKAPEKNHLPNDQRAANDPRNRPLGGLNDRSIDEIINSVKSLDDDQKLKADASLSKELDSGRIPLEMNEAVKKWIGYFTGRDRERFQRFLNRGETYRPMIMAVLRDQEIPPELYFQAMIESGFQVHAKSHAQAVGIWQFIKPTGKRYGLRINKTIDERRDPIRATIAASLYLRDLYNVFQSWYLAMAAYNAGEGRILNAIMKAKTRDFWEIARRRQLPSETMDYIPKFLAAAIIGHHPEKYGFSVPPSPESFQLASIQAPGGRSLPVLASALEVPLESLKEHNPHLLKQVTPADARSYRLWLPAAYSEKISVDQLAMIPPSRTSLQDSDEVSSDPNDPQGEDKIVHRVRRGETLEKISQLYQVSISELKALNRMRSNKIFAGQKMMIAAATDVGSGGKGSREAGEQLSEAKIQLIRYTVRPGDNLAQLAQKFGVSISEIKRLNRLRHHKIYAGQVLKVASKG